MMGGGWRGERGSGLSPLDDDAGFEYFGYS